MMVHVRQAGRSYDLRAAQIQVTPRASDAQIRSAVARHLNLAEESVRDLVVDRRPSGDIVLRPEAVYG
jgi:hypothetical protein